MRKKNKIYMITLGMVMLFLVSTINVSGQSYVPENIMEENSPITLGVKNWQTSELPSEKYIENNQEDFIDQLSDIHPESSIGTHSNALTLKTFDGIYDTMTSEGVFIPESEFYDELMNTTTVTSAYTSYQLDLEGGWSDIDYNEIEAELCIYGGVQATDPLQVDIWNGENWATAFSDIQTGWNNVSISSALKYETVEMRFRNTERSNISVESSWEIDCILIHTWTTIYSSEYTSNGLTQRVGDNLFRYTTSVGERNTYNEEDGKWYRYLYDPDTKSVKIGNMTITSLSDGALTIVGDAGSRVGRLSWYIQAYYNDVWQNITLSNFEIVGIIMTDENITMHQRFWDVQGEMNVYLTYSYFGGFKTRVDITNKAAVDLPIRAIWAAQDVRGIQDNYELVYTDGILSGIQIEDAYFGWNDVLESDNPLPVQTVIDKLNRRAAVIFGNQSTVIPSGFTASIDPPYHVAVDGDDTEWDYQAEPPHEHGTRTLNRIGISGAETFEACFRVAMAIPKYSIVTDTTFVVTEDAVGDPQTCEIYRNNSANVGTLEGGTAPVPDASMHGHIDLDGNNGLTASLDCEPLVQAAINEAEWASGNYIGFIIRKEEATAISQIDDKQGVGDAPYISVSYTVASTNWLSDYRYRQAHSIDGSAGAGTKYQIKLTVDFDTATSADGTIYVNGKSNTDFDDIRFTDDTGNTELHYWVEEKTDSDDATFWVNVTDDLGSDQVIYVYYGKTGDSSDSDGPTTFLLFDNFNDASINTTLWDTDGATESGGIMSIAVGNKYIKSDTTYGPDIAVSARTSQTGARKHNFGFGSAVPYTGTMWIRHCSSGNAYLFEGNTDTDNIAYVDGSYDTETLYWKEDYGGHTYGGTTLWQSDGDISGDAMLVGAQTWGSSTAVYLLDWIFVRNWIVTEPSSLCWGREQTAPVVNNELSILNADDTDILYARYRTYNMSVNVSCESGYGEIEKVVVEFYESAAQKWSLKYNGTTGNISEAAGSTSWIEETGSVVVPSGVNLYLYFGFKVEWFHDDTTDSVFEVSSRTFGNSTFQVDWFNATEYNVETRLHTTSLSMNDGSGTVDRGNYDTIGDITASGKVIYYNSVDNYPPSNEINVFVNSSQIPAEYWNATNYDGADGTFEVLVDSDDVVGIDNYDFRVVKQGDNYTDTNLDFTLHTDTYVSDSLTITITGPTDNRQNINANASGIVVSAVYGYLGGTFDGTLTLNDTDYNGDGTVKRADFTVASASADTHGVTAISANDDTYMIWDALTCYVSSPTDQRDDLNANATGMILWAIYDYDNAAYDGTLTLNNTDYNGDGTVVRWDYNVTIAAGDDTHGISIISASNTTYMIWDSLICYTGNPTDQRINIGANASGIVIWANYSYDGTTYDGTLGMNDTFIETVVGIYYYIIDTANGDDTHGITDITSSNSTYCIFDSVTAYVNSPTDQRINIGANASGIEIWANYSYDNTAYDGTLTLNDTTYNHGTVGIYYYNVTVADGLDTYGITVITNNGNQTYCIFDALIAYVSPPNDQRIDIDANATGMEIWAVYDYDAGAYDGTLQLNDTTYNHGSVGIYYYNVTTANGDDTYGITVITNGGNQTYCIFDRVSGTVEVNMTWTVVGYYINVSYTGTYEYDSAAWTGYATIANTSLTTGDAVHYEELTKNTVENYTFYATAIEDVGGYGLTGSPTTNTVWCIWDDIDEGTLNYYPVQYTEYAAWIIVGSPSSYEWDYNNSAVADGILLQSQANGTDNARATTHGGSIYGLSVGVFDETWFYVNITIYAQFGSYNWSIWSIVLFVDILHSINFDVYGVDETDNYVIFEYYTTHENTTWVSVYDNITGTPVLVYNGTDEGSHRILISDVVGTHSLIFNFNQSMYLNWSEQVCDPTLTDDWWAWTYYNYIVSAPVLTVSDTVYSESDDYYHLSGIININCDWYAYNNDSSAINSGSLTEGSFSISWDKNSTAGFYEWGVKFTDGTTIRWVNGSDEVVADRIEIVTYTLFGAGSDFTYMQYSFYISHDCTFSIKEWSDTWAVNETHTGSVSAGDANIAWDKIGVNDIDANYTITFTNGSLTLLITGSYITAYKLLSITDINFEQVEASDSYVTNLTINFNTNKDCDWYVYDVDDSDAVLHSGSSLEGSDSFTWVENTQRGIHNFAVKWTDGVTNEWYNSSYWVFDKHIDEIGGGGDIDQRRTIEFWATVGGIISFFGLLVLGAMYIGLKDEMKKLQMPHYETQDTGRSRRK